jgi:hypothetical protein
MSTAAAHQTDLKFFLDGTAIDSKGHIEVCPVSFTTSLFSDLVCRFSKAWRLLGFIPDLNRD